ASTVWRVRMLFQSSEREPPICLSVPFSLSASSPTTAAGWVLFAGFVTLASPLGTIVRFDFRPLDPSGLSSHGSRWGNYSASLGVARVRHCPTFQLSHLPVPNV